MRNINCDEVLPRQEFINLNDTSYEEQVIRFCEENLMNYRNNTILTYKESLVINKPEKEYEIFKLNSSNPRIFLLNTNQINYDGDSSDKELYYTSKAAYQICFNKKILAEDATVGNLEIQADLTEEKSKILAEIEELIQADEDQYNEDRFIYNALDNTVILDEYNKITSLKSGLEEENKLLKDKLKDQENQIIDLSNKLKISLKNIEDSRVKLNITNKNKFEIFLERLKEILK